MGKGAEKHSEQLSVEKLLEENLGWLRGWLGARLTGQQRQEVDDLCQEVFLRALRGAGQLQRQERFAAWLYRIASNVLRDYLRQSARFRRHRKKLRDVADPKDPSSTVEIEDEYESVLDQVLALPRRYREPMILRHVKDLAYVEIGKILGISENSVQVRIYRARQMLRRNDQNRRPFVDRRPVSPARAAQRSSPRDTGARARTGEASFFKPESGGTLDGSRGVDRPC